MSDPIIHRTRDGKLALAECDPVFVCARESLEDLICRHNKMADERDEARSKLASVERRENDQITLRSVNLQQLAEAREAFGAQVEAWHEAAQQRDRLAEALLELTYERGGRYRVGVYGDTDVTDIVAPALAYLNQPREGSKS